MLHKLSVVLCAFCASCPSPLLAEPIPKVIFTEAGIYLSSSPEAEAKIGEKLSLMELGRRFPWCRVAAEYYQGEDEGILTTITCDEVVISVNMDEANAVSGFWTTTRNAAFANNVQVGDPVVAAFGRDAYCNLCTEDEMPYCKSAPSARVRYDIDYDYQQCVPTRKQADDKCWGNYRLDPCVKINGLGHASTEEMQIR